MGVRLRNFLFALCIWELCLIGAALVMSVWLGQRLSEMDLRQFLPYVLCGVLVCGVVAIVAARFRRAGAIAIGTAIGLIPSAIGVGTAIVVGGFETGTVLIGLSLWFALPSGLGGAVSGLICCRRL